MQSRKKVINGGSWQGNQLKIKTITDYIVAKNTNIKISHTSPLVYSTNRVTQNSKFNLILIKVVCSLTKIY